MSLDEDIFDFSKQCMKLIYFCILFDVLFWITGIGLIYNTNVIVDRNNNNLSSW